MNALVFFGAVLIGALFVCSARGPRTIVIPDNEPLSGRLLGVRENG